MSDLKTIDPFEVADEVDVVDAETSRAIRAGIRDADAGRMVPLEEVRKLIPQWIAKYTSPKPQ